MRSLRSWVWLSASVLGLSGCLRAATPVTIGGVTYESVDPGEPFKERAVAAQEWAPPKPTGAETAAGLLPYVTSDPGDYVPRRVPQPQERVSALAAFLAQDEYEPVWLGVYGLADLQGLTLRVDPRGAPVTVEVRHLHCWPQRTGWRNREWYMTPELLLPCGDGHRTVPAQRGVLAEQSFDLRAGETAGFWLTLYAAAEARPGTYELKVSVGGRDRRALELPLRVEVLPFRLERPADRYWLLYADTGRWRSMAEAQILAELRDFARHGITGLVEMPLGTADLSELRAGKVRFDPAPFLRMASLCRQAGLPGPHVCSPGGYPERVREVLGLSCDLAKQEWPEPLKAGVAAVARAAVEATAQAPARWLYYGVDEPSGDNTYAIQDYQCWRSGGAATYATFYTLGFLDKAAAYLTAPCFVAGLISEERTARKAWDGCAKGGAEFWWYGTGSYVNPFPQEGCMFPNRYGAGYLFWKSEAKAQVSWTFCRPHEDVFNDFDGSIANSAEPKEQVTAYPHLLKPDDWGTYQGAIPTIAWESLREGIDDYCYLHRLTALIAAADGSQQANVRDRAREVRETLAGLLAAIPWLNPLGKPGFETQRLQQVRRRVADLGVGLHAAMAGQVSTPSRPPARIKLAIRTADPVPPVAADLPVLSVVGTSAAPTVDGLLDDVCWPTAAAVGAFRYLDSGEVSATPTEARVGYDQRALYVAFRCPEPAMDKRVAKQQGHDPEMIWLDDSVELFLAGPARQPYAHLIVNTNGAWYDEINQSPAWNPAAEVGVRKAAGEYCVELALPWAELERAGVSRAPVMALNLCRSRFAGAEPSPHQAWSFTGGGFHVPERFGLAVFQDGPVALAGLDLPRWWGRQSLQVRLRNTTPNALTARAGLKGEAAVDVTLAPGVPTPVQIPVELTQPGTSMLSLTWGVAGQAPVEAVLPVTVPDPIAVGLSNGLVSAGATVDVPLAINLAPDQRRAHRIQVSVSTPGESKLVTLGAKPGTTKKLDVPVAGRLLVQVSLLDADGRAAAPPTVVALTAL